MRRLPVVRHLTARRAWGRYRECRCPVAKTRWHLIWLLLRADRRHTPATAAAEVGVSVIAARATLRRWNARGPSGLADGRAGNGGRGRLTAGQWAGLRAAVVRRPPDGGLWSGPKVARYVAERWRVVVRPQTGWRWLRRLGLTLQVPRPSHPAAADRPARRRWKKTCGGGSPG